MLVSGMIVSAGGGEFSMFPQAISDDVLGNGHADPFMHITVLSLKRESGTR